MIELVLGGARSGKSRYAEKQAQETDKPVLYIATAEARDAEMQARIARHRQDRPGHWQTLEEPVALGQAIARHDNAEQCILVDCLTLWLSNILFDREGKLTESRLQQEKAELLAALSASNGDIILVSNEVGQGVVPIEKTTRRFVDEAGFLHQDIARISAKVTLICAGLPLSLKG
ncbi:bifunctional adenosylcobinamide kinase/adenosylcobinamide-phosphate guanylyltransferase [methane-oxidizing endosymbiont of Gigantopelta aegis]|uniref:bifunctional adenosylcobinamide kinase/adenosylcobinamide-phosphate guanylyltransferase n=1 Tax=methane-oxidizing endosymbiont of Gigantopelta aegis TaxID=2794938 RepID=UPI0018DD2EA1|nr:bifunctional adenosylcobinamide kinase/adenosylcobinamide-phosphate guanylyltransferase [methane-oxidizing endosymbiont of Gigantopelta aegis]